MAHVNSRRFARPGGTPCLRPPALKAAPRRGARLAWLAVIWMVLAVLPALAHAVVRAAGSGAHSGNVSTIGEGKTTKTKTSDGGMQAETAEWSSRFLAAWRVHHVPHVKNIQEARGRILYSPVRATGSDGLGHAMSTINADVSAALRLGLAYSHRIGRHGSLTAADARAVERFFGWGSGAVPREKVMVGCKNGMRKFHADECRICRGRGGEGRWERGVIERVVELPANMSYAFYQSFHFEEDRQEAIESFLREHDEPNTVFQMPTKLCRKSPAQSFFSKEARAHFYTKYWHARRKDKVFPELNEWELNIAIHARRGDFFRVHRPMTKVSTFGVAIRQMMSVVLRTGGPFAKMGVVVHLYSEGEPLGSGPLRDHDVTRMSNRFVDADGKQRGAEWVRDVIKGGREDLFRNGLRVEMRIARDTLASAHEMIAADIFFGSLSGLSTQVVGSLSRAGVVALPTASRPADRWAGHCPVKPSTGVFRNITQVEEAWSEYADYYEVQAARAIFVEEESKQSAE